MCRFRASYYLRLCVREADTCRRMSLCLVNYAQRRLLTWPACVRLWSSNERERVAGGRRDGLQSTPRTTAPTAGSRAINRARAESFDTWIHTRSQFPCVRPPSRVLRSFGAASHVSSLSKVVFFWRLSLPSLSPAHVSRIASSFPSQYPVTRSLH